MGTSPCSQSELEAVADGSISIPSELLEFCRTLPKAELHAHMNGCVRDSTIRQLLQERNNTSRESSNTAKRGDEPAIQLTPGEEIALQHKGHRSLAECFQLFGLIHRITTTHTAVTRIAHEVVLDFWEDGVLYLELRTTPKDRPECGMTKDSYIAAVLEGVRNAVDACRQKGRALGEGDEVLGAKEGDGSEKEGGWVGGRKGCMVAPVVKLLLSIDRREGPEEAMRTVRLAERLKGEGVVGIDLSGNPAVGSWSSWQPALEAARALGLKVTLHAAEVPNPLETLSMLDFRPERLGHMCCTDDAIDAKMAASGIPVELCLTSNLLTNSVPSYSDHHFQKLYLSGHPVVLCTDDSGIFSTTLSREYAIAAMEFGVDRRRLVQLAAAGFEFVFCSDEEKQHLQEVVKKMLPNLGTDGDS